MLKWIEILFWIAVCSVAGLSCYFLINAIYLFWSSTGPLLDMDLRQGYILEVSPWFAGFLVCSGGVAWLLIRGRGYIDRCLADEERSK